MPEKIDPMIKEQAREFFTRVWESKEEFIEVNKTSKSPEEAHQRLMELEDQRKQEKQ